MARSPFRIVAVTTEFEDHRYRTPIKFGGVAVDRVTLLNVRLTIEHGTNRAEGFGSMPLGNAWSFPSKRLTYDQTLSAMKSLVDPLASLFKGRSAVHPIDLAHELEPEYFRTTDTLGLSEPIPHLATLVAASPFDAAVHDAFGKLLGVNCYHTYDDIDVSRYLGSEFAGVRLSDVVSSKPQQRMPLYHLVGALDPLTLADVATPVGDGLPETLGEWVGYNGLTHLKIKLNGDDLNWDVNRVLAIETVIAVAQAKRGVTQWHYSLDFNEKCANVAYLLEFLDRVKLGSPQAFGRIQYIEQPTARDLKANRDNVMHAASRIVPVVIDESLLDLESLVTAREMGYTGAALKACKGQSQSLLMAAAARKFGLFLCVQDLTCPGASLIHSAGLAAHVNGVAAIEANARQYVPSANKRWADRFPGLFRITDGTVHTGELTGPGLGIAKP